MMTLHRVPEPSAPLPPLPAAAAIIPQLASDGGRVSGRWSERERRGGSLVCAACRGWRSVSDVARCLLASPPPPPPPSHLLSAPRSVSHRPSVCPSVSLSPLSVCPPLTLRFRLSVCLSVSPSDCLSDCRYVLSSVQMCVSVSVSLSVCLSQSVPQSVCLSVH